MDLKKNLSVTDQNYMVKKYMFSIEIFLLNVSVANKAITNFGFLICHVVTWFNGNLFLLVEPLQPCGRKDITFQFFEVTSKDYVVKESCDSMGGFLLPCHHFAKPGGIGLVEKKIFSILFIFQVETWPLPITWSEFCNFIMGFASPYASTLQSLVVIHFLEEEKFYF